MKQKGTSKPPNLQKSSNRNGMVQGFYYLKPSSSSSSSSSCSCCLAETIASMEELLTEILLRVPARPLVRFKCVSKHWLSLISDPKFCHRHTLRNPHSSISGVFGDRSINFSFIPFPPRDHDPSGSNSGNHNPSSQRCNPLNFIGNQYDPIKIIHSCNGLFLCHHISATSTSRTPFFVLNPTTNQFLTLTIPPAAASSNGQQVETHTIGCAVAFDPSKSPHYKVICLETTTGSEYCREYQIQIYSSETRSWRLLNSSFYRQTHILYKQGVYCNGAIHWVGLVCEMSYYHVDEERIGLVDSPPHCHQKKWENRMYRYFKESSGGHLHLIDIYTPCLTKFEVLEMGRDYSGWFVKYHVDLDSVCTAYHPRFLCGQFVVLFLAQVENEEEESSCLLLHSPGTVISYNLKSKTFKSFQLTTDQSLLVGYYNFPYMETLACV